MTPIWIFNVPAAPMNWILIGYAARDVHEVATSLAAWWNTYTAVWNGTTQKWDFYNSKGYAPI